MPSIASNMARFELKTAICEGVGVADETGALAHECGMRRVLLVTDPGVSRAGHARRVEQSLDAAGVAWTCFDEVHENPTLADIARCLRAIELQSFDGIVALGGGSTIDTAKACNLRLANGGAELGTPFDDDLRTRLLPLIALPTTAGTGSEVQSYAIVAHDESHQKRAYGHPTAAPRVAVLDAELAQTVPAAVGACCGLDAITHAIESAVCSKATAMSRCFAIESLRLAVNHLPGIIEQRAGIDDWAGMLRSACLGGISIENSMLGAAHSMANPITAMIDIPHGQAVAMVLPTVIEFNAQDGIAHEHYQALAQSSGLGNEGALALSAFVRRMLELAGLPTRLNAVGLDSSHIQSLAQQAAGQWTAQFNPKPAGVEDFELLFERAMRDGS